MAVKLGSIKADLKRETEGEWVDIPDLPGVRLRVRSFNYGPFRAARNAVLQRLAKRYAKSPVPDDVMARELGALYADQLLLGWDGFDVPYTPEAARETLTDPAFRSLLNHIDYASERVGQTEIEFVEQATGN